MNSVRVALFTALAAIPAAANAGMMPIFMPASVPALGQWGLIGLAAGVGSLGAWLISRKK